MSQRQTFRRVSLALLLGVAASVSACADEEDTMVVRAPPPPPPPPPAVRPPPPPGLHEAGPAQVSGAGMMIHSAVNPGMCFDAAGDRAAPHTPVRLAGCQGRENQRWTFGRASRGATSITGIAGLCLDIHGEHSANGASAQLYPCHGGGNQEYVFLSDGRLREGSTGKCLTAGGMNEGAPIVVEPCDPRIDAQIWTIADR